MFRFFAGVSAGRMYANGTESLSRNSGSPLVRWNVIVSPLTTTPFDRSHVFGVLTQASPPTMTLYQLPALGLLPILKRRSNVALTSLNVHVLPLSVGFGIAVARSGTFFVPSVPPTRL